MKLKADTLVLTEILNILLQGIMGNSGAEIYVSSLEQAISSGKEI
jgi:hypothetical protein